MPIRIFKDFLKDFYRKICYTNICQNIPYHVERGSYENTCNRR